MPDGDDEVAQGRLFFRGQRKIEKHPEECRQERELIRRQPVEGVHAHHPGTSFSNTIILGRRGFVPGLVHIRSFLIVTAVRKFEGRYGDNQPGLQDLAGCSHFFRFMHIPATSCHTNPSTCSLVQLNHQSLEGEFCLDIKSWIKDLLLFHEPQVKKPFILKENSKTANSDSADSGENREPPRRKRNENLLLKKVEKIKLAGRGENHKEDPKSDISRQLSENLKTIEDRFSASLNGDLIIRKFGITVKDSIIPAFLVFFDGLVSTKVIDDDILQPLMLLSNLDIKDDGNDILKYIRSHILPHNQLKEVRTHQEIIDEVYFGGCGLYIDGLDTAFAADVKNFPGRSVERPNNELVIRGPQEGFTENLRDNTGLIRKRLMDQNLIAENIIIGNRSKTPCSIMYIKDIANESLVNEVRRRLKNIDVDYIMDTGELEQFIEDDPSLPAPQMLATERPDRVCTMLIEGRVAIIMHGSPFALVVPITSNDIMYSAEDQFLRFPYSNLLRFIRILAILMSLLLPGIYLAITNYHHEMIPTDLLLAILSAREKVPFPSVVEVFLMEISFELIREAGIRIPGPIGPTLGIIGALILGQAAVEANIVSPILIIVVALTGLGSFAIPNFSAGFAFRILRFGFIILAALSGFLGITVGLILIGLWMVSAKSFGVPYFAPVAPRTAGGFTDAIFKSPAWKQEKRPDYINAKKNKMQPRISRKWAFTNENSNLTGGEDNDDKNE